MRWWFGIVLLCACVEENVVYCERVCPAGTVCTATGCATPEALEVCAGLAEGDPCMLYDEMGACMDGACVIP